MWNGERYVTMAIKGINFGTAVPGHFPGEMLVTREQYGRWFKMIHDAGFNTIRLYTLHFPDFYDVLDSFNLANPRYPLYFFQGVWLEEALPGYKDDLYFMTSSFQKAISENVDCAHGNRTIQKRPGQAYGTYTTDASRWLFGYIIGREVSAKEILNTNKLHSQDNSYSGTYFSIAQANPSETWITSQLDYLLKKENDQYHTQRPVSFSSWPTLDPLHHPAEKDHMEDIASVDLANIDHSNAPAGYFASFHAYPYYPDFIGSEPAYQTCSDDKGKNSYLCYLKDLKNHYNNIPLIIAEYGCPSSWGVAHFSQSGMHHGGLDEYQQGEDDLRSLKNIFSSNCGGGMLFNWMDEWFKPTWITDLVDHDINRRILWHNLTAPEQNFGLINFKSPKDQLTPWQEFCPACEIKSIDAGADYSLFKMRLHMHAPELSDTIWVALDTYASTLGESMLPNGKHLKDRAEFYVLITNNKAELYVTRAYDLYGNWHKVADSLQLFHSVPSDSARWNISRWLTNRNPDETQFIGRMKMNRSNLPASNLDAVIIDSNYIDIHLPWTLLNYSDPSMMRVIHDYRSTPGTEDTISDGISATVFYKNFSGQTAKRFVWETWNNAEDVVERKKASYDIIKQHLFEYPGNPVAKSDYYNFSSGTVASVTEEFGLLSNDYLTDSFPPEAIIDQAPESGSLFLNRDGGFTFVEEKQSAGEINFTYRALCGPHISEPVRVTLNVTSHGTGKIFAITYPNPTRGEFKITSTSVLDRYEIYDAKGILLRNSDIDDKETIVDIGNFSDGIYGILLYSGNQRLFKQVMLVHL